MWIKVDQDGNIVGHEYFEEDGYIFVNYADIFDCEIGAYRLKYEDGELIGLTEEEMLEHPLRLANEMKIKLGVLKEQYKEKIAWEEVDKGESLSQKEKDYVADKKQNFKKTEMK